MFLLRILSSNYYYTPLRTSSVVSYSLAMGTKNLKGKTWNFIKSRRWLMFLLAFLMLGLLMYGLWIFLNAPAKGDIKLANSTPASRQKLPEYETLKNDSFTLNYSGKYVAVPVEAGGGDTVVYAFESKTKDLSETPKDKLSVILRPAPYGGITLDKDYKKYTAQQKVYKISNKFYHGEAIDLAIKQTGGTEQVAMWLHGDQIMIIKLTKPSDQKGLDPELKDILTSVQWSSSE